MIAQDGRSIIWKGELSQAPDYPEEYWAYYNTIDGNSYIFVVASWNYLAKSGKDGASGIMLWLGSYDEPPVNVSTGYCYYNKTDHVSYIWDGDSWEIISKDGTTGINGKSIIWKGVFSVAPDYPEEYCAYYNTSEQKAYIWNGTSWDILSESLGGNTTVQVSVNWRGSFTSAPANPAIGDAYYNSTMKASYIYDGSIWQLISKDGADGTYTYSGTGYLITWKGSFTSAPSNPSAGWAYYNSSAKKAYVYDGSSWQIMVQDGENGSDAESGNSRVVYLGETTETIEGITYTVKSYADVYAEEPYFYTYYKYYYLNNKLRRSYLTYHSAGSVDLDYKYYEYEEHICGTANTMVTITDYYESGKIQNYYQKILGTGYIQQKFDEAGHKLEYNVVYDTLHQYTTYFESGNEKTYKYYLPDANGEFCLYIDKQYYDTPAKIEKKCICYNNSGIKTSSTYKESAGKEILRVSYNTDGSINNFKYNYESEYTKYYYEDAGYFYTYADGKTTGTSTSSSYYSSKIAYTTEQANSKLQELEILFN